MYITIFTTGIDRPSTSEASTLYVPFFALRFSYKIMALDGRLRLITLLPLLPLNVLLSTPPRPMSLGPYLAYLDRSNFSELGDRSILLFFVRTAFRVGGSVERKMEKERGRDGSDVGSAGYLCIAT